MGPRVNKRGKRGNRATPWATRGPWMGHRLARSEAVTIGLLWRMAQKWEEKEPGGHDFQVPWATENPRKSLILARLAGIEPTTLGFGGHKTIWLSDGFNGSLSVSSVASLATFHRRKLMAQDDHLRTDGFQKCHTLSTGFSTFVEDTSSCSDDHWFIQKAQTHRPIRGAEPTAI